MGGGDQGRIIGVADNIKDKDMTQQPARKTSNIGIGAVGQFVKH